MNPADPIGIFDSGVGGLSVLRAARAQLLQENFIYFADSGYAPYGDKSDAYVTERSERIGAWLIEQGVKAIVVACNTATAVALQALRNNFTLPIVGVEPGLKPAIGATKSGIVGVLATVRTLASERYTALLARVKTGAPKIEFMDRIGKGWVEAVERGEFESSQTIDMVERVVTPLLAEGCDTLVLGCTHYPFLAAAIQSAAPTATIIDTAPAIARELARRIRSEGALNGAQTRGSLRIATTGDAVRMSALVATMLREKPRRKK
ncbi:MAG: glutamate racemase [Burkholderiales bacterium]|nr:glutamate racemase [Burkholderiales bacterium]